MTFTYEKTIKILMSVIGEFLGDGYRFYSDDHYSRFTLKLTKEGFVLFEENDIGVLTYGAEQLLVSPTFVIDSLLSHDKNKSLKIIHIFSDHMQKVDPISYIEIVECIQAIREDFLLGNIDSTITGFRKLRSLTDIKYDVELTALEKELSLFKVLTIDSIVNIRNQAPGLARKLERMYKIETLLEKYSKERISSQTGILDFKDIDLDKYEIEVEEFLQMVHDANLEEMMKANALFDFNNTIVRGPYYKYYKYYTYNTYLTVFGLDEQELPGNPPIRRMRVPKS